MGASLLKIYHNIPFQTRVMTTNEDYEDLKLDAETCGIDLYTHNATGQKRFKNERELQIEIDRWCKPIGKLATRGVRFDEDACCGEGEVSSAISLGNFDSLPNTTTLPSIEGWQQFVSDERVWRESLERPLTALRELIAQNLTSENGRMLATILLSPAQQMELISGKAIPISSRERNQWASLRAYVRALRVPEAAASPSQVGPYKTPPDWQTDDVLNFLEDGANRETLPGLDLSYLEMVNALRAMPGKTEYSPLEIRALTQFYRLLPAVPQGSIGSRPITVDDIRFYAERFILLRESALMRNVEEIKWFEVLSPKQAREFVIRDLSFTALTSSFAECMASYSRFFKDSDSSGLRNDVLKAIGLTLYVSYQAVASQSQVDCEFVSSS